MSVTTAALAPPMNHVFVDYENVHQVDLSLIGARSVSFTLMVGAKQTKLDTDLVEKLMAHSSSVQLVRLKSSGKNALDFMLAYYLGRAALADPTAYFHIISKDGGFDPLVAHLRERHTNVQRHVSCADLTFTWPGKMAAVSEPLAEKPAAKQVAKKAAKQVAKKAAKKAAAKKVATKAMMKKGDSLEGWMERVVRNFKDHPKARPVKKKTLLTKVADLIKKPVDSPEVQAVIEGLLKEKLLDFDEKGVPKYEWAQ